MIFQKLRQITMMILKICLIFSVYACTHLMIYNSLKIQEEIKKNKEILEQISIAKNKIYSMLSDMQEADEILWERLEQLEEKLEREKQDRL